MELKQYNPKWKIAFRKESESITKLLTGQKIAKIEHIGATSVLNCSTLGTIDILLSLQDHLDFITVKNILSKNGYEFIKKKSNDFEDLFFIRRNEKKQIVSTLHLVHYASITYQQYILFKFYLEEGSNVLKYNKRREDALKAGKGDVKEYQKDKIDYIKYVLNNFCRTSESKK